MAFLDFVLPLRAIAVELKIIRELYEADLLSRDEPIRRVTEKPKKTDTTVSYQGIEDERPKHKLGGWFSSEANSMEDEDETLG